MVDPVDPICECYDICKAKEADAFMTYTKIKKNEKKKPKAICKCYMSLVAAHAKGKLKFLHSRRARDKHAGWISAAGHGLIAEDNVRATILESKNRSRRRRGRRGN